MSLETIYNKLSIKHEVNQKVIKETIENLFSNIRKTISSNTYPKILIKNLGSFIVKDTKLKKQILRFYNAREDRSDHYYGAMMEKINSYLRIQKERKQQDLEIEQLKEEIENEIHTRSQQP